MRTLSHGLTELRAHPWRALLSAVSLCIGVLAVVAIFTISAVTAEVFIAVAEQRDGRALTAVGQLEAKTLTPQQLQAGLDAAQPLTVSGGAVAIIAQPTNRTGAAHPENLQTGEPLDSQPLQLVAGDLNHVRRLPILQGRWLNTRTEYPTELIANQAAAARWGQAGTTLSVLATADQQPIHATIVGVIADGQDQPILYASLPALLHARPTLLTDASIQILLHHPDGDLAFITTIAKRVATATGGQLQSGTVQRADQVQQLLDQLASQRLAFLTVASIALLISALGILNIGLASVNERARELVIRRAVGATRTDLVAQVLTAATIVGLLAAATAILLAILGIEWWIPQRINAATAIQAPTLPWNAALWGLVAASTTSILGSLIPALVASRLDVANALRD